MIGELAVYAGQFRLILDGLCDTLDGLGEEALNWRPSPPGANSIYVLAAHTLGNAEAWVLGIACGQPIVRDRPAEFAAGGPDPSGLIAKARELGRQFDDALGLLPQKVLDEIRQPHPSLFGEGTPRPVSVRQALMVAIEHAAHHVGHIDITRDMALAATKSGTAP